MTNEQITRGLNEWMRRYIEEPKRFEAEFQTVNAFLKDDASGREPTYGEAGAVYLSELVAEIES